MINYVRMSKEMGLHVPSLSQFHTSNQRVLNVDKLKEALLTGTHKNLSGDHLSEVREMLP